MKYTVDKPFVSLEIQQPEALYGFTAMASRYFMTAKHWDEKLVAILGGLQLTTASSRVSIFWAGNLEGASANQGLQPFSSATGRMQNKLLPAQALVAEALGNWVAQLRSNRTVRAGNKKGTQLQDHLTGLTSLVAIPLFAGDTWIGALSLEFCEFKRWRRMEYRLIRHFTQMMGSAIHRQQLIEALKVDKRYFEELFHSSPFGIAVLNSDGEVQHINKGFTEIFGYQEKDLAGKKLDDILPSPEERESARQLTEKSLAGNEISYEGIRYRKDGLPVNVSILGRHLHPTPPESAVFSIYIDISERVCAQKLSAENRTKYQGLFEMSTDGICILENGVFLEGNSRMSEMFRCSIDNIIGASIFSFSPEIQPDGEFSYEKGVRLYREALSGKPVTFEWLHKRFDGSEFYGEISLSRFELAGKLYAQGILRDISVRKATEESLKQKYEFINFLSRASSDLINLEPEHIESAIVETLKQTAQFANCEYAQVYLLRPDATACDLYLSWTAEESLNVDNQISHLEISQFKPVFEYIKAGNVLQANKSTFKAAFTESHVAEIFNPLNIKSLLVIPMLVNNLYMGHIGFHSCETEFTWPDEAVNTLRLSSQIIANAIGRKQVISELEKAKLKAEESDRLKTAFLASMSHEIRTPMNHIIGFIELLKDPSLSETEKNEFLSIIRNSGNHLLKLIDDIIDIAKIESDQLEIHQVEISLNDFLHDQYLTFREQFNSSQKSSIQFSLDLPREQLSEYIKTDMLRLQQVLTNLLANAIKFTREGYISFGYRKHEGNMLCFFVQDSGIGIPRDNHQLIFERFRQLDYSYSREFSGTGLGLAISKGLVELLGGKIWVESEPEQGSTFYFTIPYNPLSTAQQQAAKTAKTTGEFNFEGKTILIVEDDEINYRFLNIVLERTKASILHACDGEAAVNLALSNDVDLILMDIQIPLMDGYTATRLVKEQKPGLPVIAQTAHALDDEKKLCIDAGADDYVAKPINRKQLLLKISKYLLPE